MKKIAIITCLFPAITAMAQDVQFSNLHQSLVLNNPAMCGQEYDFDARLIFRDQWRNQASGFQTSGFSIYSRIPDKMKGKGKFAAGLACYQDQSRNQSLKSAFIRANLAYHLKISDHHHLGSAIYLGYFSMSYSPETGAWASQHDGTRYNPLASSGESGLSNSVQQLDAGAGFVYGFYPSTKRKTAAHPLLQCGWAMFHANKLRAGTPDPNLPLRQSAFISMDIRSKNRQWGYSPIVSYARQQQFQKMQAGMRVSYYLKQTSRYTSSYVNPKENSISYACYVSARGNLSNCIGISYERFALTLSYDYFLGKIQGSPARSAAEIGLAFNLLSYDKKMLY